MMEIIIDTREQKPLPIKPNSVISEVKYSKLDYGDYSCVLKDGHVVPFFFERKSLGDLYGSLTGKRYERLRREFKRARANNHWVILIVEVNMSEVKAGYSHSTKSGIGTIRQLFTILFHHQVHTIYCKGRAEMMEYIKEFYLSYAKSYVDNRL